jgi:hypothetical protein
MNTNHSVSRASSRGFAPLLVILVIVFVGGGTYAVVQRDVLKSYFESGDVPTEEQFKDTIDSAMNLQDDGVSADTRAQKATKVDVATDMAGKIGSVEQVKVLAKSQTEFKLDTAQPVSFSWGPVATKTPGPVTYRLKVWQLMQGQNASQAMKTNQPVVTKDVDNMTEVTVSGIYTGPCRPPYLCDYVWSVDVVAKETVEVKNTEAVTETLGTQGSVDASLDAGVSTGSR